MAPSLRKSLRELHISVVAIDMQGAASIEKIEDLATEKCNFPPPSSAQKDKQPMIPTTGPGSMGLFRRAWIVAAEHSCDSSTGQSGHEGPFACLDHGSKMKYGRVAPFTLFGKEGVRCMMFMGSESLGPCWTFDKTITYRVILSNVIELFESFREQLGLCRKPLG
ncbi:unnamed protein product [Pleuronectes platessa]|uniref:Uncharacterized protein n=1 Tax=Pleuronectes platessa TaxID=8262 RepID=A0A9N7YVK8_PLEPL|nr:unnamed protein product [Pleuronectes platessa]